MSKNQTISTNRKANHDYIIKDKYEAGIVLSGQDVKKIVSNTVQITASYVTFKNGAVHLMNFNPSDDPDRQSRILLLNKKEISRIISAIEKEGMTAVPLRLYTNDRGRIKVEIATAKGKDAVDKRNALKKRDWNLEKSRLFKDNNR